MRNFKSGIFSLTLLIAAIFSFGSSADLKAQNAVIHLDSTAQIIRGFGGANIVGWRPDLNEEDIQKVFGTEEGQLGLSILRIRIPPNKDQWSDNLPTAQKAYQMGVKVIASPWSPPASMKTNDDLVGGRLKKDSYADYASFLRQFEDYMENNGVPLYAISIQNEPDIEVSYESCDWNAEEMTSFLRDHGDSLSTKVIAPESFQFRREISDAILSDSAAASNVDIIGGHIYGGGLNRYFLPSEKGKEIWMTEYLKNQGATDEWEQLEDEVIWDETVEMLDTIQRSMIYDWNAYIWWYLKRYYSFLGDGEQGTEDGVLLKRGYAFSHFSRFVKPGFHRVYTRLSYAPGYSSVSLTAYTDSSKAIIIAVNGENSPKEVNFSIAGGAITSLRQHVTSLTENMVQLENVEITNNSFTLTLPAKS
ncbi:MAG TPA: cellulose-binding protein, partial [Balneolaceae bacterium]|nr:cellulose-binding protein [Balneolaceae bacterium]